jgi:hypothetical protein
VVGIGSDAVSVLCGLGLRWVVVRYVEVGFLMVSRLGGRGMVSGWGRWGLVSDTSEG